MAWRARLAIILSMALANAAAGSEAGREGDKLSVDSADQVLLVRAGSRTVVAIKSAYQGDLGKFVFVVPTPVAVKREDLHLASRMSEMLDSQTRPYLISTPLERHCPSGIDFDGDSGIVMTYMKEISVHCGGGRGGGRAVDVDYSADPAGDILQDYDVKIWTANRAKAMLPWLRHHGFAASAAMRAAVAANIRQHMSFIVATINMPQAKAKGWTRPPPLQFVYDSQAYVLPYNLAALGAESERRQDLLAFFLTLQGATELSTYPAVALAKERDIGAGVAGRFGKFYDCMLDGAAQNLGVDGVESVVEYFGRPQFLRNFEIQESGARWLSEEVLKGLPASQSPMPKNYFGEPQPFYLTRLHIRYSPQNAPTALGLAESPGRQGMPRLAFTELLAPQTSMEECKKPIADLDCDATCDAIMSNAENKIYPKLPRSHEACVASCRDEKVRATRWSDDMGAALTSRLDAAQANLRAMCPAWHAETEAAPRQ